MTASGPPHELLFATEAARALAGLVAFPLSRQLARVAPKGCGAPVLVLPGLLADDLSTRPLRSHLRAHGFAVHGWQLGRNLGPTPQVEKGLRERVARLADRYDRPIAVVGWSLGGIYARAVASERPDAVSQVVTLGTPFAMVDPRQTRAHSTYARFAHLHAPGTGPTVPEAVRGPLPVPATSIWSRYDGIVSWRTSLETESPTAQNIAVRASHLGLGHHPAVLLAVADRVAQVPGQWRRFTPPRLLRSLYPETGGPEGAVTSPAA